MLLIYGDIGESWSDSHVMAAELVRELQALPPSVTSISVRINSYGGSVADGLAIYNALRAHPARILVTIDGVAASIASVIAMAGDEVRMPSTALMMIHAPWGANVGNAEEMRKFADTLDYFATAMASAYAAKSGSSIADVQKLLDGNDYWFTAEEAIAAGYADRLADAIEQFEDTAASAFALAVRDRSPPRIAAAMRHAFHEGTAMPQPTPGNADTQAQVLAAERDRRNRINALSRDILDSPGIRDLRDRALDDFSFTPEAFGQQSLAILGRQAEPIMASWREGSGSSPTGAAFVAAVSDALLQRAGIRVDQPHPAARDFRHVSVLDIARSSISRSGRSVPGFGASPEDVFKAAMVTDDFPLILENALHKSIRRGMEAPATSHRSWCRTSGAKDFKTQSRVILGSAPSLAAVGEGAEYTYGALTEDKSSLTIGKFGRIVALSWEALVNDDVNAFLAIGPGLGLAALRAEANAVYNLLTMASLAGVTMQDGKELFHADHNNTVSSATGTGKPLNAAALSAARAKLRRQTSVGGELLNLEPRALLVPPERESEAEILVASATRHNGQASAEATVQWLNRLTIIAEPRLANVDTCYVVADSNMIDCGEISVLEGCPTLTTEEGFDRDIHKWKMRHAFAAGILDHRGIVKLTLTT